jgi:hypothetical protein
MHSGLHACCAMAMACRGPSVGRPGAALNGLPAVRLVGLGGTPPGSARPYSADQGTWQDAVGSAQEGCWPAWCRSRVLAERFASRDQNAGKGGADLGRGESRRQNDVWFIRSFVRFAPRGRHPRRTETHSRCRQRRSARSARRHAERGQTRGARMQHRCRVVATR